MAEITEKQDIASAIASAEWEAAHDTIWTARAVGENTLPTEIARVVVWSGDGNRQAAQRIAAAIVAEHNAQQVMAEALRATVAYYNATRPGIVCLLDQLNPCGGVRHWGGGDACPLCAARALLARIRPEASGPEKRFLARWNVDFIVPGEQEVGLDFFIEGNGYSAGEIEAIAKLDVGEVWASPQWGDSHTVTRIDVTSAADRLARTVLKTATDLSRIYKEAAQC